MSVVVQYICTNNQSFPSGTAVEQIESECNNGEWFNIVEGSIDFTCSQTTEASFYYNNSMCVDECLSPFQLNTANVFYYECVCPTGTTGYNCCESIYM